MSLSEKWSAFMLKLRRGKSAYTKSEVPQHVEHHEHHHRHHQHHDKSFEEEECANLSEVSAPEPVQNRDEDAHVYVHHTLEEER